MEQTKSRKYTKRSAGERVSSKVEVVKNLASHLNLGPEALALLERIQAQAAEKADAGELKPASVSTHPVLASLVDEQKRLNREIRSARIREIRAEKARIEAEAYRENVSYRDTMSPWLESAIERVRAQIKAGETPNPGQRPDIDRVDVVSLIENRMAEFDAAQNESEDDQNGS